jgi:hypothetical protein
MHNIDRTQIEANFQTYEFEQRGWTGESEGVFGEAKEMQLASGLMQVRDGLVEKAIDT